MPHASTGAKKKHTCGNTGARGACAVRLERNDRAAHFHALLAFDHDAMPQCQRAIATCHLGHMHIA